MAKVKTYQEVMTDLALLIRAVDQFLALFQRADPIVKTEYQERLLQADGELRFRLQKARE